MARAETRPGDVWTTASDLVQVTYVSNDLKYLEHAATVVVRPHEASEGPDQVADEELSE